MAKYLLLRNAGTHDMLGCGERYYEYTERHEHERKRRKTQIKKRHRFSLA